MGKFKTMSNEQISSILLKGIIWFRIKLYSYVESIYRKLQCLDPKIIDAETITVNGEEFFYSFSFDIDDFIGDGITWLQIYDLERNLIYDKPFASTYGPPFDEKEAIKEIEKIIKIEFLNYKAWML